MGWYLIQRQNKHLHLYRDNGFRDLPEDSEGQFRHLHIRKLSKWISPLPGNFILSAFKFCYSKSNDYTTCIVYQIIEFTFLYSYDNDSKHTSKSTKAWMEDNGILDHIMKTPASSPKNEPNRECLGFHEAVSFQRSQAKDKRRASGRHQGFLGISNSCTVWQIYRPHSSSDSLHCSQQVKGDASGF